MQPLVINIYISHVPTHMPKLNFPKNLLAESQNNLEKLAQIWLYVFPYVKAKLLMYPKKLLIHHMKVTLKNF
jgi:hypothetical protein